MREGELSPETKELLVEAVYLVLSEECDGTHLVISAISTAVVDELEPMLKSIDANADARGEMRAWGIISEAVKASGYQE